MKKALFFIIFLYASLILFSQDAPGHRTSLWNNTKSLFNDPKAKAINDIVIIKVEESTKAENSAETKTKKGSSSSLGINTFLGFEKTLAGKMNPSFDPTSMFGHSVSKKDEGTGSTKSTTKIQGYIAAKVVEVIPNGNLIIEAKKEIIVNNEKQTMILRGMVRPRDIDYKNFVSSNAVADVQIMIRGKGPIAEQQRRGWLSWLLSILWPF
jgi:flagellar L-ring protein precursor FlgH